MGSKKPKNMRTYLMDVPLRAGFLAPPAPLRGGPVLQQASWLHAKSKHSRETPVSKDPNLMQRNVGASAMSRQRADDEV